MLKRRADSSLSSSQRSSKPRSQSLDSTPEARPPTKCSFLDLLPPELRLTIYEYLVVSPTELKGKSARKEDEKTSLDLTILRVNQQIHAEALPLFYGKNTFYISSIPDSTPSPASHQQSEHGLPNIFNPPLPRTHWPLIRHLTINPLYIPSTLISEPGTNGIGWKPINTDATIYIHHLVSLLTACATSLLSLKLTADIPDEFDAKKCLVGFFMCDADPAFADSLAAISTSSGGCVGAVPMAFEFEDCFVRLVVGTEVLAEKGVLLLACRVMFCQSRVRFERLMGEFGMRKGEIEDEDEDEGVVGAWGREGGWIWGRWWGGCGLRMGEGARVCYEQWREDEWVL